MSKLIERIELFKTRLNKIENYEKHVKDEIKKWKLEFKLKDYRFILDYNLTIFQLDYYYIILKNNNCYIIDNTPLLIDDTIYVKLTSFGNYYIPTKYHENKLKKYEITIENIYDTRLKQCLSYYKYDNLICLDEN